MQNILLKITVSCFVLSSVSGCVSTVIDAAVDTTIAVAKVPFKVAGAAVDVVSGSDDDDKDDEDK